MMLCLIAVSAQQRIVPDNYPTIQSAIDDAQNGDTVLVKPGEYFETIEIKGKSIVVGSQFLLTSNMNVIGQTIINSQNDGFNVKFSAGADTTSQLVGFTLLNGGVDTALNISGLVLANGSSPKIRYNTFRRSIFTSFVADFGAVYLKNSDAVVENNFFDEVNHHSSNYGAMIYTKGGKPQIRKNHIEKGYIGFVDFSAGILLDSSDATVEGNKIHSFTGGYVHGAGAGIMVRNSNSDISFNTISNLTFDNMSGGILGINSDLKMINNTIYYNVRGITLLEGGSATVKNTIIWNSLLSPIHNQDGLSTLDVTFSDIEDGWPGKGNIDAFPKFSNPFTGFFYLEYNSPCIEAGDPASPLKSNGRRTDIGAWLSNIIPTNVHHIEKGQQLSIWPNPATDKINIIHNSNKIDIALLDLTGKLLKQQQSELSTFEMDISDLPKGTYILNISSEEAFSTEKLIIQ